MLHIVIVVKQSIAKVTGALCTKSDKKEFLMHCSVAAAEVDAKLFEKCGANNHFLCYGKELSTDTTRTLSQVVNSLPKLLGLNALEVMNEITSEL